MKSKTRTLYALEQMAGGHTWVHRLHPAAKLSAVCVYIAVVLSFDRYALGRLVPYVFFPTLLMALSETPYTPLLKRFSVALPFCFMAGVGNAVFDRAVAFTLGGVTIRYGVLSLLTILLRTYLCVMAVLLLVAVTPLAELTQTMRRLKIPPVLVAVLELTYRYIGVLVEETDSMAIAYTLRNPRIKGVALRDMGSFAGQLLLRSLDRAERVYGAMKCRGYTLQSAVWRGGKPTRGDIAFVAAVCLLCGLFRFYDVTALWEGLG